MKHYPTEKRNQEMELARKNGETYAAIGKRYGISPSRVMSIISNRALRRKMMDAGTWPLRNTRPIHPD